MLLKIHVFKIKIARNSKDAPKYPLDT